MLRFVTLFLCVGLLHAAPQQMGLLLQIRSNDALIFSFPQGRHYCEPYGIITLYSMLADTNAAPQCHQALKRYYGHHPYDASVAQQQFYLQQHYPVEIQKEGCIISVQGRVSYGALLLQKGLAITPGRIDDKRYMYAYERAQSNAKEAKTGLWSDAVLRECMQQRRR